MMSTDTSKITTKDIEGRLFEFALRDLKQNLAVLRCTAMGPEADLLTLSSTAYLTEYEIKTSYSDFRADFKKSKWLTYLDEKLQVKKTYHGNPHMPNYFYYCYPKGLIKLDEIPNYAGAIEVSKTKYGFRFDILKRAPRLSKVKCNPKLMRTMIRSLSFKTMNLLRKES